MSAIYPLFHTSVSFLHPPRPPLHFIQQWCQSRFDELPLSSGKDRVAFISTPRVLISPSPWRLIKRLHSLHTVLMEHKMKTPWHVAQMEWITSALLLGSSHFRNPFSLMILRNPGLWQVKHQTRLGTASWLVPWRVVFLFAHDLIFLLLLPPFSFLYHSQTLFIVYCLCSLGLSLDGRSEMKAAAISPWW